MMDIASPKRIGLMVPASNTVMEYEFNKYMLSNITIHASRFEVAAMTPAGLAAMREQMRQSAALLRQCSDLVILGILSGTIESDEVLSGIEGDIQAASCKPAVTVARALVHAIQSLSPNAVRLITPYSSQIAHSQKSFLQRYGIPVTTTTALNLASSIEASQIPSEKVSELLFSSLSANELPLLSCTNVFTLEVIKQIYHDKQLVAISSNLACLWFGLNQLGFDISLPTFLSA